MFLAPLIKLINGILVFYNKLDVFVSSLAIFFDFDLFFVNLYWSSPILFKGLLGDLDVKLFELALRIVGFYELYIGI